METGRLNSDDAHAEFGPFEGHVWLNCAHQGPLPRVALDAARAAIREKGLPHLSKRNRLGRCPNSCAARSRTSSELLLAT